MNDFIDNIYLDSDNERFRSIAEESAEGSFTVIPDTPFTAIPFNLLPAEEIPGAVDARGDDDDSVIDTSWLNEYDKLNDVSNHIGRTSMEDIYAYFVYINRNNYIDKVNIEKIHLDKNTENRFSYIPKESLLKIIQDKKIKTPLSKYKLIDILSFVIDIEPELMQGFSNNDIDDDILSGSIDSTSGGFFKVLPIIDDVVIHKSIFVFHNINCLYFIFQEFENIKHNHSRRFTLRSILKSGGAEGAVACSDGAPIPPHNSTKKVRIAANFREHSQLMKGRSEASRRNMTRSNRLTRKR